MSENLENFLVDVSSDPQQLSRFTGNPARTVGQSRLNDAEKAAVLSGSSQTLADTMGSTGYSLGVGIDVIEPMRAPSRRKPARKAPAKRKAPARKAPAKRKSPARKKSPAKRKAPVTKRSPARKKSPAKRSTPRKSTRKPASRKRR